MSRIRNRSFGSGFGSVSGLQLVSDPNPDSNPELEFKSGFEKFISVPDRIRIKLSDSSGSGSGSATLYRFGLSFGEKCAVWFCIQVLPVWAEDQYDPEQTGREGSTPSRLDSSEIHLGTKPFQHVLSQMSTVVWPKKIPPKSFNTEEE